MTSTTTPKKKATTPKATKSKSQTSKKTTAKKPPLETETATADGPTEVTTATMDDPNPPTEPKKQLTPEQRKAHLEEAVGLTAAAILAAATIFFVFMN